MAPEKEDEVARLIRVEEHVRKMAEDMSEMKDAFKDVAAAIKSLAVLEVKHSNVAEALSRAFKAIEKGATQQEAFVKEQVAQAETIKKIVAAQAADSARITEIEKVMPNIELASSWVFKAVLVLAGASSTLWVVKLIASGISRIAIGG